MANRSQADCRPIDVWRLRKDLSGGSPARVCLPSLLDDNQSAAAVDEPIPGPRCLWGGRQRTCGCGERDGISRALGCFFGQPRSGALPWITCPGDATKLQLNQMRSPDRYSNLSTGVDSRGHTCFAHSATRMRVRLKSPLAMPGGSFSRESRIGAWQAGQAYRWRRVLRQHVLLWRCSKKRAAVRIPTYIQVCCTPGEAKPQG